MAGRQSQGVASVPATAEAVVDLLNSRPHATPLLPDTLDDPDSVMAILRPFTAPGTEPSLSDSQLKQVRQLRSDLLRVVLDAETDDSAVAWSYFTAHTSTVTLRQIFAAPGTVHLDQVDGDPVVGGIALAVAELIRTQTWSRIRICVNELCSHAFYDSTRSRTQRWHSYEVCGNRHNAAAYRARRSSQASN